MRKSTKVTITIVAAIGSAARVPAADPCDPATFNEKVCKSAVSQHGFCENGEWSAMQYGQKYPYYYDLYQNHLSAGGAVTPAVPGQCRRPGGNLFRHGGFGATGGHTTVHS